MAAASLIGHAPLNAPDSPDTFIRVVHSPDDGGYYAEQYDREGRDIAVSKKVYPSRIDLMVAIQLNAVKWKKP